MKETPADSEQLIWIDLEMTGLDPLRDQILELAIIVTDAQLEALATAPVIAIHHPEAVLLGMDEWNTRTHSQSGLWQRVLDSDVDYATAEKRLLEFLRPLVPEATSPMCGNSICQDRRFLARLMPRLEAHFHYRNLDVSTIKELARRWAPRLCSGLHKETRHEALADIRDSIDELRYYRRYMGELGGNGER